jgi:drug/metabolite transporter (DMT)-like permease
MLSTARKALRDPSVPRRTDWGVALAVVAALISGLAVYLNAFAVKQLPDAAVYTTLKNAVAALMLIGFTVALGGGREALTIERRRWPAILLVGVVGGSVPFVLFFSGLAQASAPTAAFIQKTLFIWVAVLAVPLLGERLGWAQLAALAVLLAGQALVLNPAGVRWGTGETLIAVATLLWAVETVIARRVLRSIPAPVVGAARLGFGLVVLVAYLGVTNKLGVVAGLGPTQVGWVLVTGGLLAGYVGTWFAALRRAPASLVTAVLVVGAPVTAALQALASGAAPAAAGLVGNGMILAAGLALAGLAVASRHARPKAGEIVVAG